jgi:HK97 family phage major capsid protein
VLDDMQGLQNSITGRLVYNLALEAEEEVLTGDGSSQHLEGLMQAASAYNRGGTGDTRADTLRKAITQLLLADHVCSGFVIHPHDAEQLDLLKDSNGQYLHVTVGNRVWDVPAVVTNSMTQGQFLSGDFQTGALVRPRQEATIAISNSHQDFFIRNLVAIRAELRMALEIHRPGAFVRGTF